MIVSEAIDKAYTHATRKSTPLSRTSSKYLSMLVFADTLQKLWADEPDIQWNSLYQTVTLTATVTATDTFSLTNATGTISALSEREGDVVLLTNGTSSTAYTIVNPNQLYSYRDSLVVAKVGNTLKFPKAFLTTDTVFGYNIKVPAILSVGDVSLGTETVVIDRPSWLVWMLAAEFCRTDALYAPQYDHLLALADQVMQKMKQLNGGQRNEVDTPWTPEGISWA